jgi:YesN/AraC family two-component response regulator
MEHERWLQSARILHYAVRLPVRLYREAELQLSLPDPVDPVWNSFSCGGAPASWPVEPNCSTAQYVTGRTGERYICHLPEDAYALCVGPFCMDSLNDKELNRLLKIYVSSVRDRDAVRAAIQSLKRLSEDCFFYTGQLLQMLFNAFAPQSPIAAQSFAPESMQSADALYRHPPYFLEREVSQCIADQDEKNALSILSEINRLQRANLSDVPLRSLKNSLICSCSLFTRAAIAGGAMPDAAFSHSDTCIRAIEDMHDMERLAEYEYTMVREFIHLVRRRKEGGVSAVIRAAIIYANEHLLEPVTVRSIAQSIFVNPSYLSSDFKQEVGESLSHYIRRKRIRHAEKLLREGNDSMADVAAACQFCSQSHFIQVFKKIRGLTPEQFRRMEGTQYRQGRYGIRINTAEDKDETHTHRAEPA